MRNLGFCTGKLGISAGKEDEEDEIKIMVLQGLAVAAIAKNPNKIERKKNRRG